MVFQKFNISIYRLGPTSNHQLFQPTSPPPPPISLSLREEDISFLTQTLIHPLDPSTVAQDSLHHLNNTASSQLHVVLGPFNTLHFVKCMKPAIRLLLMAIHKVLEDLETKGFFPSVFSQRDSFYILKQFNFPFIWSFLTLLSPSHPPLRYDKLCQVILAILMHWFAMTQVFKGRTSLLQLNPSFVHHNSSFDTLNYLINMKAQHNCRKSLLLCSDQLIFTAGADNCCRVIVPKQNASW